MTAGDERDILVGLFGEALDKIPEVAIRNIMRNMGTIRDLLAKVVVLASAEPNAHTLHQRVSAFLELEPTNSMESLMSVGARGPRSHALDATYFRGMNGG